MNITVSRCVYESGVNSLRVEGVKAATINENLKSQHTKCLDVEFYSTEDLQTLIKMNSTIFSRKISNLTRNSRNPKKRAYTLPPPDYFYAGIRKAIGVSEHMTRESHIPAQRIVIGWEKTTITRPIGSR